MTPRIRNRRREAGVGIVTAIFLLVVLAGLGVAMVALFTSQQASSNLDVQGARAYQAARAGMEWGLYRRMRSGKCDGATKVALEQNTTLSGFTVWVSCASGGTAAVPQYTLTAIACNVPDASGYCTPSNNPESVSRTVEVQL